MIIYTRTYVVAQKNMSTYTYVRNRIKHGH